MIVIGVFIPAMAASWDGVLLQSELREKVEKHAKDHDPELAAMLANDKKTDAGAAGGDAGTDAGALGIDAGFAAQPVVPHPVREPMAEETAPSERTTIGKRRLQTQTSAPSAQGKGADTATTKEGSSKGDKREEGAKSKEGKPEAKAEYKIVSFFPGWTTPAWPLAFSALALIIVWFAPARSGCPCSLRKPWLALGAGFTILTWITNIAREIVSQFKDGRRIYSHTNLDLAGVSTFAYFLMFAFMSFLMALIWIRWLEKQKASESSFPRDPVRNLGSEMDWDAARKALYDALEPSETTALSDAFHEWQRVSVLLALAFAPGAFLYWTVVHDVGDMRYVFAAGTYHLLYAATWYVVSHPLLKRWSDWHHHRVLVIASLTSAAWKGDEAACQRLEAVIEAYEKSQPFSRNGAVFAAVVSAATLFAPLYQLAR